MLVGHQGLLGHCTIYRQLCPLPPFPASSTRCTVSHSDSEVTAHKDMPLPIPWQRWVLWAGLSSSPGWRWTGLWRPPCSTPHTLRAESVWSSSSPLLQSTRRTENGRQSWPISLQPIRKRRGFQDSHRLPSLHGDDLSPWTLGQHCPKLPPYSDM